MVVIRTEKIKVLSSNTGGSKNTTARIATRFHADILLGLFNPEDGVAVFPRNVGWLSARCCIPISSLRGYANVQRNAGVLVDGVGH
jgi:hypothetical protein